MQGQDWSVIETHPFVLKLGTKVRGRYARAEDALKRAAHMGRNASVFHVAVLYRNLDGAELVLSRKDRARGASSHLKGMSHTVLRHRVPCGVSEHRIY